MTDIDLVALSQDYKLPSARLNRWFMNFREVICAFSNPVFKWGYRDSNPQSKNRQCTTLKLYYSLIYLSFQIVMQFLTSILRTCIANRSRVE